MGSRPPQLPRSLSEYEALFAAFVSEQLDGESFEQRYNSMFSNDPTVRDASVFRVLNDVFFAADSYYGDPALREDGDLDVEQLREHVRHALRVLAELKASV